LFKKRLKKIFKKNAKASNRRWMRISERVEVVVVMVLVVMAGG